jgi:hypothetical protein
MKTFSSPPVGSTVSLTVRAKTYYYYATDPYEEYTLENRTVLKRAQYDPPGTVRVQGISANIPVHVIPLSKVIKLKINGKKTDQTLDVDNTTNSVVTVTGSKGDLYTVIIENGQPVSCTCKGFMYRHRCSHFQTALKNKE